MGKRLLAVLVIGLVALAWPAAPQQRGGGASAERWVATWATAQQLAVGGFGGGARSAGRGGSVPGPGAALSNTPAPQAPPRRAEEARGRGPLAAPIPATFADQTVRMIARASAGGTRVRIELSNMSGAQPVEIGAAHIALHNSGGAIVEGSDRALTFGGSPSFTLQPGVLAVSDPVELNVPPLADLAVSLYLPRDTGAPTSHMLGLRSAYISKGNVTGSVAMPDPEVMYSYVWLSSIDVAAPPNAFTVVALGDSITDGFATTRDADAAWPSVLARRLQAGKATRNISVVNQGISGNQVLRDGAGLSALTRFDRDVLSRPGVKWVILLEGINDINIRGRADGPGALTAEELIWGYRQILARAHAHGIKVIGATLTPEEGVPTASERGEAIRLAVNQWIRTPGNFDAVVDFDAALRDPQRPARLKEEFDPGDHIHPNDAGNKVMAGLFDLSIFTK
jgi:lysophospholipase L1-like esterase